eukprot:TRINITY_DN1077_c0_g2_i2.p2 TRINITY_DN1077_c0_g2~~TRINITY_DN1077_c0_g2_i2.p2  ORF type:complete len:200 (-),score=-7.28 TRINITY_DN1077_c0_g2_i2:60-659(-)
MDQHHSIAICQQICCCVLFLVELKLNLLIFFCIFILFLSVFSNYFLTYLYEYVKKQNIVEYNFAFQYKRLFFIIFQYILISTNYILVFKNNILYSVGVLQCSQIFKANRTSSCRFSFLFYLAFFCYDSIFADALGQVVETWIARLQFVNQTDCELIMQLFFSQKCSQIQLEMQRVCGKNAVVAGEFSTRRKLKYCNIYS